MNIPRILLSLLRILQCASSLVEVILELFRYHEYNSEERAENRLETCYEYFVIGFSFVISALYIYRRWNQGPYKVDILIDCVLMNAWMIFSILLVSPQYNNKSALTCDYKSNGCIINISAFALGTFTTVLYFLTSIVSTWIWADKKPLVHSSTNSTNSTTDPNNNPNNNNNNSSDKLSSFNRTGSNRIINSQSMTQEEKLKEFIERHKHLKHFVKEDSEFNERDGNKRDGKIAKLRKPSPSFLRYEPPSHNSCLCENGSNPNKNRYISEYSLDSSFSKTYGSIIIPRKYTPSTTQSDNSSTISRYDGSIIIKNPTYMTSCSENSSKHLSSTQSEVTSRSSKYDGSIIIKLVEEER